MKELEQKTDQELQAQLQQLSAELAALRHKSANGQLTEVHMIGKTRRSIAQVHTALSKRKNNN